jgi:hypothetical protein
MFHYLRYLARVFPRDTLATPDPPRWALSDITGRMRRITDELREVQQQLQDALLEGPIGPETIGPEDKPVMLEEVKDFKATVDQMRHFLWFFVQAVSEDDSGEKLVELLRQAAHGMKQASALDQINSVSDYAILHYPIPPNRKPN